MVKDFRGQNCRGRSFKGLDLTGADFSGADLSTAKFCRAKMGRTRTMTVTLLGLQLLLSVIAGVIAAAGNSFFRSIVDDVLKNLAIMSDTNLMIVMMTYALLFTTVTVLAVNRKRLDYILWFFSIIIAGTAAAAVDETGAVGVCVGVAVNIFLGVYLGWRATKKEESQLLALRNQSLKLACLGGTQFAFATLKDVDFSGADLKYARFQHAKFMNCCFQRAQNHHLALTNDTPLALRKVRDLIVNGITTDNNFAGLDLNGLDFSGLDLQGFNFADTNVSFANFANCHLENTNLREINAVGTCFNAARLTGACIQNWNIDTRTQLHDIVCEYVYLAENGQQRNPPEGVFAAGEFSKLYQQIADTIDFIVHSRPELDALIGAIGSIKVQAGNEDIFVQNIERKESSIVVKVKAPPEFDRDEIYKAVKKEQKKQLKQLTKEYEQKLLAKQTELELELERKTKDLLADLLKDSIQRPITMEQNLMKEDNSRHFSGNNNTNVNLGDNSTLSYSIQQLPAEQDQLKDLLSQLQTLINTSPLPDTAKQKALTKTQDIAEATKQPKEEQQNIVQKTLGYFDGLADSLENIPETAEKLAKTAAGIAVLFGL